MPPKKSIFKRPGARHFQLVHRSQRDPLIHDPEASTHVLKPIIKGQSRITLEQSISPSDLAHDLERANIGEAALYGVYYDDTEYDYMQHLREAGTKEEGVESILIEAPVSSKHAENNRIRSKKGKGKSRGRDDIIDIRDLDLPSESLPSKEELTREQVYNSQGSIPAELVGFQPDMNPHLRQTLEALEDDAFVDESLQDDFFAELVGDGELEGGDADQLDFEFRDEGIDEGEETEREERPGSTLDSQDGEEEEDEGWEARFARFKKEHEAKAKRQQEDQFDSDDDHAASEGRDTVGHLPSLSVIGGKKRRRGTSEASGYSMSSSSMFRNEGLTLLDERFDQVEKQYESDSDDHPSPDSDSDTDSAPELLTSREDFNAIMDDFLENYEIIGGKMKPVLPGETVSDKLGTLRQSFRDVEGDHKDGDDEGGRFDTRVRVLIRNNHEEDEEEEESDDTFEELVEDKKERWDCETILSTYSNLENHPKLIRARDTTKAPKIQLDPKTGLPSVKPSRREKSHAPPDGDPQTTRPASHVTTARKRGETRDEKRARKQAAKEDRQERRTEKKATQTKFAKERRQQLTTLSNSKRKVRKL